MDCLREASCGLYCTILRNRTSVCACFSLPGWRQQGFALQSLQTLRLLHTPEKRAYAEALSEDQMSDS